jgi:ectoine hydroxylase-related dioxygenase (phytanoyl-CoA dioxygenase family)
MTAKEMNLPDLSSDYPLSEEQIASYQQNGFILLRGVCSPEEVAAYRPYLSETVARHSAHLRKLEERDTYGKAFIQIGNLWLRDEGAKQFVLTRRFAKIAGELMNVAGIRLYHDQALYKEAGGGHTPWHQDQNYWPFDTPNTITMWMPLVDITPEMGTMRFASGSHRGGAMTSILISDESEDTYRRLLEERNLPLVQTPAMRAGDATFHAGWTLHGAPGNQSDRAREVMTIIYYEDGVHIMNPVDSPARQADMEGCFPGRKPGDLAVTEMNPLLYAR